jgi:drug/metabolite transporter (DMT)-like permease
LKIQDLSDNSRGIIAMLVSQAGFIINDTLVKVASENLPTGEIMAVRGFMASSVIAFIAWRLGAFPTWSMLANRMVILRTAGEIGATTFYLHALFRMPIANATAILQALPLVATAAAAIFLKEKVGWRRWVAIMIGFAGVLLIVQPGPEGFNFAAFFALAAVLFMTLRDLSTRQLPKHIPSLAITTISAVAIAIMGCVLGIVFQEQWVFPDLLNLGILASASIMLLSGYYFVIVAMRSGDMSVVAPFRYSIVIWAIVLGIAVFGDIPSLMTLAGMGIVTSTGVYTFLRERKLSQAKTHADPIRGISVRRPPV